MKGFVLTFIKNVFNDVIIANTEYYKRKKTALPPSKLRTEVEKHRAIVDAAIQKTRL